MEAPTVTFNLGQEVNLMKQSWKVPHYRPHRDKVQYCRFHDDAVSPSVACIYTNLLRMNLNNTLLSDRLYLLIATDPIPLKIRS